MQENQTRRSATSTNTRRNPSPSFRAAQVRRTVIIMTDLRSCWAGGEAARRLRAASVRSKRRPRQTPGHRIWLRPLDPAPERVRKKGTSSAATPNALPPRCIVVRIPDADPTWRSWMPLITAFSIGVMKRPIPTPTSKRDGRSHAAGSGSTVQHRTSARSIPTKSTRTPAIMMRRTPNDASRPQSAKRFRTPHRVLPGSPP